MSGHIILWHFKPVIGVAATARYVAAYQATYLSHPQPVRPSWYQVVVWTKSLADISAFFIQEFTNIIIQAFLWSLTQVYEMSWHHGSNPPHIPPSTTVLRQTIPDTHTPHVFFRTLSPSFRAPIPSTHRHCCVIWEGSCVVPHPPSVA